MEVEVGSGKSSLIHLVATKFDFEREEGTRLVTDHNYDLDSRVGGGEREIHRNQGGGRIYHASNSRGIAVQGGR